MVSTKSAEGFSPYVSFILIVANLIRIFWWQAEHFSNVILNAAIVMVICQLVLLYFWVDISNQTRLNQKVVQPIQNSFWHWSSIVPYIQVLFLICCLLHLCQTHFQKQELYVWCLGTASSAVEALIGCPQFQLNFERKHTKGLAIILILMWFVGDVYKLSYYGSQNAPIQLLACAGFQSLTDVAILCQFWIYRKKTAEMIKAEELSKFYQY